MSDAMTFHVRINDGDRQEIVVRTGIYRDAAAAAIALLGAELPAEIEIWAPDLVTAGYGPLRFGAWEDPNYGNLIVGSIVKLASDGSQRQPVVEWQVIS